MPFARELRLVSLALLDSTSIRPLSGGIPANFYGPPAIRNNCTFANPKIGNFVLNKVLNLNYNIESRQPILKAMVPQLLASAAPRSSWLHTEVINPNMTLKKSDDNPRQEERPLVVILSWMMAKGKHMDKYGEIYLNKGFDVLIVTLPPMDLLFPKTGSHVLAENILKYLEEHQEYSRIILHAFSVGAYLFSEVLVKLSEDKPKEQQILSRFIGLIFDSAVDFQGIPKGFPRAVAKNPILVRVLEMYTNTHLKLMHETATKHYLKASQTFHNSKFTCPVMLLVSDGDPIGNPTDNTALMNDWLNSGVNVYYKCWPKSGHCSHMIHYPKEYLAEVEGFLNKIGLSVKAHL